MADSQTPDLSDKDFVYGPFVAYKQGEDVVFKCVEIEEVPPSIKLTWSSLVGDASDEDKNSEFLAAFTAATSTPAYSRFARFSQEGTVLAPYMTYGPFVVILDDRGEILFREVPISEMIPVQVKYSWAMSTPNSDIQKVYEWQQAVNAVAEGKSPQFCRWSPLRGSGDASIWRVVSK